MLTLSIVVLSTVAVTLGRFTVPGHDLTGWSGLYEFLAHVYVTSMVWVGVIWWGEPAGLLALSSLAGTSALETVMFFAQKARRNKSV